VTRNDLVRAPVDLSALARETSARLHDAQPERKVEFSIAEGILGEGDGRLLQILIENLLGNAWKFTSKRAAARIEFGRNDEKAGNAYFVRDDGAGFNMEYASKLFGVFQRLHTVSEFDGTGIGLATVQRIVHRHGGSIWAEAQVDRGATFYFTLEEKEPDR
jgi:light-regulated signal transduction histidine kinase (bacteriophytochrome)